MCLQSNHSQEIKYASNKCMMIFFVPASGACALAHITETCHLLPSTAILLLYRQEKLCCKTKGNDKIYKPSTR